MTVSLGPTTSPVPWQYIRDGIGSVRDVTGSVRDVTGSVRDVTGSVRDVTGSVRDVTGSVRDVTGSLEDQTRIRAGTNIARAGRARGARALQTNLVTCSAVTRFGDREPQSAAEFSPLGVSRSGLAPPPAAWPRPPNKAIRVARLSRHAGGPADTGRATAPR